jgi:beta-phosphoglucomutase-like phosphatase (HAD superfamily)
VAALVREWARHIPVAIASGALRAEIELILETEGLRGCFAAIVSADDPVASKPSPEPYQLAMRQLTERARRPGPIDPARCVAVEDSRWGIAAARAAGMRIVGVASSYAATELADADVVIAATGDLSPQVVSAALRADPRGDRRS